MAAGSRIRAILKWPIPKWLIWLGDLAMFVAILSVACGLLGLIRFALGFCALFLLGYWLDERKRRAGPLPWRRNRMIMWWPTGVQSPPDNPEISGRDLLLRSMNRYAAMNTFQATVDVEGLTPGCQRHIFYEKPNRFRVESVVGKGNSMTAVSDGESLVEFGSNLELPAMKYASPASITDIVGMLMVHPMFCGSLLYRFFGGESPA